MPITDWPPEQRPREKLLNRGPSALSDAELLALFLRTGIPGRNAIELAGDALRRFGGLRGLLGAPLSEFSAIPGLGAAKYTQLQAIRELGQRVVGEELAGGLNMNLPALVHQYLRFQLGHLDREVFLALFLDVRNHLIATAELFRGTLTETRIHTREVVKAALQHNAAAVILAHNHPSGLALPSEDDFLTTRSLQAGLRLVEVTVLDHVIVAGAQVYSFRQEGRL